jgi:quinol monooxygenase YgiN
VRHYLLSLALLLLLLSPGYAQSPNTNPAPTGLFVKFKVKPGQNAAFETAFRQMQVSMREHEPGNVYYDLFTTVEDPQVYVIMERYQDAAAVAAHGQTEHMRKVLAELRELLDGPPVPQSLIFVSGK